MKNRIKALIDGMGITAYQFAKDTGISVVTVYRLSKNANRFPSGEVFEKIIKAYPSLELTANDIVEVD